MSILIFAFILFLGGITVILATLFFALLLHIKKKKSNSRTLLLLSTLLIGTLMLVPMFYIPGYNDLDEIRIDLYEEITGKNSLEDDFMRIKPIYRDGEIIDRFYCYISEEKTIGGVLSELAYADPEVIEYYCKYILQ